MANDTTKTTDELNIEYPVNGYDSGNPTWGELYAQAFRDLDASITGTREVAGVSIGSTKQLTTADADAGHQSESVTSFADGVSTAGTVIFSAQDGTIYNLEVMVRESATDYTLDEVRVAANGDVDVTTDIVTSGSVTARDYVLVNGSDVELSTSSGTVNVAVTGFGVSAPDPN